MRRTFGMSLNAHRQNSTRCAALLFPAAPSRRRSAVGRHLGHASDRLGRFTFKLPRWLSSPAAVFRIDADGFHKIAWEIHNGSLTIEDRVNVAGMYISAVDNDLQNDLAAEFDEIKEAEQGVGFDPGNKPDDLKTLKAIRLARP